MKKQRQKEFSGMRPAKLREESSILKNIQRREMIDKILHFSKVRFTARITGVILKIFLVKMINILLF